MFGRRFFGAAYFGPRYWGDGGAAGGSAPTASAKRKLAYGIGIAPKTKVHPHPKFNS